MPKCVVNLTDYTTHKASCSANATQEPEDVTHPTLETDEAAVNRNFDNIAKQLKHSGYIDATLPSGETDVLHYPGYERSDKHGWVYGNHPAATKEQHAHFQEFLVTQKPCFAYSMEDLPGYNGPVGPLTLPLLVETDIVKRSRRFSAKELEIIDTKCEELRIPGFIVPCPQPWTHVQNICIAAKKDLEGNWTDSRMCIDYRPINAETKQSNYPMVRVDDCLARAANKVYFSKLDARSGFSQIPVAVEDQKKTSFWWKGKAWMYTRAPFGLTNIPAHFQDVMDHIILTEVLSDFCCCYIDDILIFSDTVEDHERHVKLVLQALYKYNLRAHPDKSIFMAPVMEFLGFNVNGIGITPMEAKVAAIKDLKSPTNVSHLRSLLGFLNYYRSFVENFSKRAAPLTQLLRNDVPWDWTEERELAYQDLKNALCVEGVALQHFNKDRKTIIHTDWSSYGLGAVLGQVDELGREVIVACISRSLNKHEANYSSFEGEMLAAVWAVKTFRPYVLGLNFSVVTDHSPLQWLMNKPDLTGKHARWALSLQEFTFVITHRPGVTHQNADVPSRYPQDSKVDITGARLDEERITAINVRQLATNIRYLENHCTGKYKPLEKIKVPPNVESLSDRWSNSRIWSVAMATFNQSEGNHDDDDEDDPLGLSNEDAERHAKCIRVIEHAVLKVKHKLSNSPNVFTETDVTKQEARNKVHCNKLCMNPVSSSFYDNSRKGIVLYEPFGGMCAGLEMTLRCNIPVHRYYYSDIDPVARSLAVTRLQSLHSRFPSLLPTIAFQHAFVLPQNIKDVDSESLLKVGVNNGRQWLVIAGWECQDLSNAGSGKGLQGRHSSTFFPLMDLCASLQLLQPRLSPAFIFENTSIQTHRNKNIAVDVFNLIYSVIGKPVLL